MKLSIDTRQIKIWFKKLRDRIQGRAQVLYSRDGKWFYVDEVTKDFRPRYWMSVIKTPGEPSEEQKQQANKLFSPALVEFRKYNGDHYFRECLHFTWWSVKPGVFGHISRKSDEYLDYLALHRENNV